MAGRREVAQYRYTTWRPDYTMGLNDGQYPPGHRFMYHKRRDVTATSEEQPIFYNAACTCGWRHKTAEGRPVWEWPKSGAMQAWKLFHVREVEKQGQLWAP